MSEEIDRWIAYMNQHPKTWKKEHTKFINAQFDKQEAFMQRLLKEPGGKEKVIDLYKIKNPKGYQRLLS